MYPRRPCQLDWDWGKLSVDLTSTSYIPTVFLRYSELKAIAELPDSAKDILTPIFCLKPWATSELLAAAIGKIEGAFGDREYFLDIDPFYEVNEVKRTAQQEFLDLIDEGDGNQNWVDFFHSHPRAFPCLQVNHGSVEAIRNQIDCFTEMDKSFLVRLDYNNGQNFSKVIQEVCATDHSNFGFVLDAGWSRRILDRTSWLDSLVKQIVNLRGGDVPISVTGSSFPDSFADVELGATFPILERQLFRQLQQANNQAKLVYGDWASSRSPSEGGGGKPIPPRIDLATNSQWASFRCKVDDGGFVKAAKAAKDSKHYPKDLNIWATYMVESTVLDDPGGITTGKLAAAARINLHLFRQLYYDSLSLPKDTDDDYIE
jgi:hypothetical protein